MNTTHDDHPLPRFGAHVSIAGGVHKALETAFALRMDCMQIFVKNQRQWAAPPLKAEHVARWHELLAGRRFGPVVAHASYVINLASDDRDLWSRSKRALTDELLRCQTLHIPYLVVHPGAAGEQAVSRALRRVARALDAILTRHADLTVMPLLETTAGQGTSLGRSFAELGEIIGQMRCGGRVGVCLDSCHLCAAGYDLRDAAAYEQMVAEADREVGLERVRCWHLNDSRYPCGSNRDRHEHVGHGVIGTRGFGHIVADPRFAGLPMILETPKGTTDSAEDWDRVNLRTLRRLARSARRRRGGRAGG